MVVFAIKYYYNIHEWSDWTDGIISLYGRYVFYWDIHLKYGNNTIWLTACMVFIVISKLLLKGNKITSVDSDYKY